MERFWLKSVAVSCINEGQRVFNPAEMTWQTCFIHLSRWSSLKRKIKIFARCIFWGVYIIQRTTFQHNLFHSQLFLRICEQALAVNVPANCQTDWVLVLCIDCVRSVLTSAFKKTANRNRCISKNFLQVMHSETVYSSRFCHLSLWCIAACLGQWYVSRSWGWAFLSHVSLNVNPIFAYSYLVLITNMSPETTHCTTQLLEEGHTCGMFIYYLEISCYLFSVVSREAALEITHWLEDYSLWAHRSGFYGLIWGCLETHRWLFEQRLNNE